MNIPSKVKRIGAGVCTFFRNNQTSAPHKWSRLACTAEYWLELQSFLWGCGSLGKVISQKILFKFHWATIPKWEASVCVCMQTSGWYSVAAWYLLSTMVLGFGKKQQMSIKMPHQSSAPPFLFLSFEHMTGCHSFTWLMEPFGLGWIMYPKCTELLGLWVTLGRLEFG